MTTKLTPFEGLDVVRSAIEIPNAAGGLRDALDVEPVEFHHGDEGYVTLHYRVKKVRFDEIRDVDDLTRVHVFDVDEATFMDEDEVLAAFESQRARIRDLRATAEREEQRQREAEAGIMRIPGTDGDEADEAEVLTAQHNAGTHADGLREGCPLCDAESDAEAAEVKEKTKK